MRVASLNTCVIVSTSLTASAGSSAVTAARAGFTAARVALTVHRSRHAAQQSHTFTVIVKRKVELARRTVESADIRTWSRINGMHLVINYLLLPSRVSSVRQILMRLTHNSA